MALLMLLSVSGVQWLCACGLCPTSQALLQAEPEHACCAKADHEAGWHDADGCGCAEHGQALAAAEVHTQPIPHAVATWTPVEAVAPAQAAADLGRELRRPLPRPPPTAATPVWLQTLNLLI